MNLLRLLGPVDFVVAGGPLPLGGPKERAALTLLAIHVNDAVSESRLIDALWGDEPPRTADRTVQSYVSRLRRSLAAAGETVAVETAPGGYRLCVDQGAIDVVQAERLAAEARTHSSTGDPERAAALLSEALAMWVGPPLGEFAHEAWALAEASRLTELRLALTEERIEAELDCGLHDRLIPELESICTDHPFRERLWSQRMLALYRAGRQADALEAYRKLSGRLAEELGVDPSPSVKELELSILRQDPALEPPQPARKNEHGLPLPPALAAAYTETFVGRQIELEALRECWSGRTDGSCRAVFIGGEPGIGKSSLVSLFARNLHDEGAVVLFGTCEEDLDVAYQPFAEALGPYVASCPADVLHSHVRRFGGDIARLVPEITRRLDDVPPPLSAEPGAERYRLFEAVSALLHEAAAEAPVLLVLDDLQWANRPTILLLRHVLRQPQPSSLLVIGQYRDTERTVVLTDALADLRRQAGVRRLALGGLAAPDVVTYLEATGGTSLGEQGLAFARRLHDETNGSPYFVSEVIRHLVETGTVVRRGDEWASSLPTDQFELPASIREVITRRIGRLSEATRNVLYTASVIGPSFEMTMLEAIQGDEGEATLEALEEAHGAGMVREGGTPGTFHFAHELVRHALYEGLSALRRARVQRLVAQALERRPDSAGRAAEIAVHYLAGAADGAAAQAIEYAAKAATQANDRVAYEEAVHFYERGLEVAEWAGLTETGGGCDLLIGYAEARWKVGDVLGSRETYGRAAQLARRLSDPERLARAALRADADLGGYAHAMSTDEALVEMLEDALVAIPPGDNELRARLLARLAVELFTTPHAHDRRRTFADEAVEIAQRLGDKTVLLYTRHCREWATVGPDLQPATRLERAAAILNLASSLEDLEVAYQARFLRFVAFLEMGDFVGADAEAAEGKRLAERLGSPGFVPWITAYESLRAWIAGRLEEADALSAQALEQALKPRLDPQLVFAVIGAQGILFRYLRDTGDVVGMLEPMIDQFPNFPTLRVGLALLSLYGNDIEGCRRHFEEAASKDLLDMPRDGTWLLNMGMAGASCAALDDKRQAEILYPLLLPYAERWVAAVVTSFGPMTRIVGSLATTLEWYEVAEIHFERALVQTSAVPAPLFEADTRLDFAKMLLKRNGPDDVERAREQLEMSLRTAEDLGLVTLESWARELAAQLPPAG